MSKNNDEKDKDVNFDSHDIDDVKKVWIVEWNSKFEKTSTTDEITTYLEALEIFNERTKEEKDTILYEIQKSVSDEIVIKKVPILNSSKYIERKKNLHDDKKELSVKNNVKKPSLKVRIIILVIIIVALLITIYWMNFIASGGLILNPHLIFQVPINEIGTIPNNIFTI